MHELVKRCLALCLLAATGGCGDDGGDVTPEGGAPIRCDGTPGAFCPCRTETHAGVEYLFCVGTTTWEQARDGCRSLGNFELVRIDSESEQAFVWSVIAELGGDFWIGLSDAAEEGEWVWTDGSPLGYSNWAPTSPDDGGGDDEDCAEILFAEEGRWNDRDCATDYLDYVCESRS